METIELLADTVNAVNEIIAMGGVELSDVEYMSETLSMAEAKLEQEGYSIIPFSSRWAKDT